MNKNPKWKFTCEQCMRCVNICPNVLIYETLSGDTEGKNRYLEPDFKPVLRKL